MTLTTRDHMLEVCRETDTDLLVQAFQEAVGLADDDPAYLAGLVAQSVITQVLVEREEAELLDPIFDQLEAAMND